MIEPQESDIEIFERQYHCWRESKYLGIATFADDENVGPSFLQMIIDSEGRLIHEVFMPDKWMFA